jgi:hypothetical protein
MCGKSSGSASTAASSPHLHYTVAQKSFEYDTNHLSSIDRLGEAVNGNVAQHDVPNRLRQSKVDPKKLSQFGP